jgi:phospholipid/cholesterol/gamma-HCH transport system substrate-binding protein
VHSFWTPLRVGLVVAAAAIAFALGLYFIGANIGGDKTYGVYAMFDDATGLGARSRVQIAGIPVGQVDRIELDQQTARAKVWLKIRQQFVLHQDATISKRSESILGDFLLDLTPGTANQPALHDGDEIRNVVRQPGMNEIFGSLNKIAGDISEVTSNLRKVLGTSEGEDNLRTIVSNLRRITTGLDEAINRSTAKIDGILNNVQAFTGDLSRITKGGESDVMAILRNTRDATAEARDILRTVGNVVGSQNQEELRQSVGTVRSSLDKLDKSLANVQQITEKINTGQGTIGHLLNDDKLGKNLDKASSALSDLFGTVQQLKIEIQERSEFLVGVPAPARTPGSAIANYSYNPWTKNYFSFRIIPKPDKWYGFEIIDDPRGYTRRVQIQNQFPDPNTVNPFFPTNVTQITTERQLKFSAYLAKRYGWISGRFGIVENTGGFGVKFHLFNDSLTLAADTFEFANPLKDHPRVKLYADYRFMDHLLVTIGGDDLVNKRVQDDVDKTRIVSGRDFFVGAGFYFNDDDIKLLLSALPLKF